LGTTHKNEGSKSFIDSIENRSIACVPAMSNVCDSGRVDIGSGEKEIQTSTQVHDLLGDKDWIGRGLEVGAGLWSIDQ
jgi:hypothetical protein